MLNAQYNLASPTVPEDESGLSSLYGKDRVRVPEGESGLGMLNGKQNIPGSHGPSRHDGAILYEVSSSSIVFAQRKSCSAEISTENGFAVGSGVDAGGFADNIAGGP